MTGLWLASYIILWLLVVGLAILLAGSLRQVGALQALVVGGAGAGEVPPPPAIENDGPPIGSPLPPVSAPTVNSAGRVELDPDNLLAPTALIFMTPVCEGCQSAVGAINRVAGAPHGTRIVVAMVGNESANRAFLDLFPLQVPVISDSDRALREGFSVSRSPLALLYDESGTLRRKALLAHADQCLEALVYDRDIDLVDQVFPAFALGGGGKHARHEQAVSERSSPI